LPPLPVKKLSRCLYEVFKEKPFRSQCCQDCDLEEKKLALFDRLVGASDTTSPLSSDQLHRTIGGSLFEILKEVVDAIHGVVGSWERVVS